MYFKNNLQDVLAELKKDKAHYEAEAQAWEAVEIAKTKTGAEYGNIVRAVKNAEVSSASVTNPTITVRFCTALGEYQSDSLKVYGFRDNLPEDDPRYTPYYGKDCGYTYWLNAGEIRDRIAEHVNWCKRKAAACAEELAHAERAFNEFHAAIKAAENALAAECVPLVDGAGSTLWYAITER